ncbi:uncharacterized protein LOC101174338 [Oryzias latipes]|uniref:uncharacterized protein LOC101174338 n=1 Tax=Oryzias latipes TaxID=8090 RepID=UPI0005CC2492|nr:uncharacterized protein LOC101174338 [Oryzias latipes]
MPAGLTEFPEICEKEHKPLQIKEEEPENLQMKEEMEILQIKEEEPDPVQIKEEPEVELKEEKEKDRFEDKPKDDYMSPKTPSKGKAPAPKKTKVQAVQPQQESSSDEESEQASVADTGDERSSHGEEEPDVEEKIVSFFKERPHFYDLTHASYKNKQRRNFELTEFASALGHGWTAEKLWKRFVSLRTDYGKLLKVIRKDKSNSGAKKLTPKQQWKLRRMQFLDPHRKKAGVDEEEELGNVPTVPAGEASDAEEVSDADDTLAASPKPPTFTPAEGVRGRKSLPQKKDSSGIATVLREFLQAERGREEEVNKGIRDRDRLVDERTAWSSWFASACADVPAKRFREFQGETFSLLMRYLNPPTVPVATQPPPQQYQPQQQTWQQPPHQPLQHTWQQPPHQPLQHAWQQPPQQYQRAYVQPDSSYNTTVLGEPTHTRPTSATPLSSTPILHYSSQPSGSQHQQPSTSDPQLQHLDEGPRSSFNKSGFGKSGPG